MSDKDNLPSGTSHKKTASRYSLLSSDSDDSFDDLLNALTISSKNDDTVDDAWDDVEELIDPPCEHKENHKVDTSTSIPKKETVSTKSSSSTPAEPKSFWFCKEDNQTYGFSKKTYPDFSIPAGLYENLYSHQRSGVQFLASLYYKRVGGILGDDMGMGKTYQTLTYVAGLMKSNVISNALVVAPVSVLRSWEKEASNIFKKATLRVYVCILSSNMTKDKRAQLLGKALKTTSSRPTLIITTYGMVRNETALFSDGRSFFNYVVLDEGHTIKNPKTAISEACRSICGPKTHRLLLSGTPIMNNLRELWAVFDWATDGQVLGDLKNFKYDFAKIIEEARNADATDGMIQKGAQAAAILQERLKPHFLQRLKADFLADQLPSKHDIVLWTHLSEKQRSMYNEFVNDRNGMVRAVMIGETSSPLTAITWLKKLCGHPLLIDHKGDQLQEQLDNLDLDDILASSSKLQVLVDLMQEMSDAGHKTLIFSQSTRMLDVIERVLLVETGRIDGSTKEHMRQTLVDEFNEGNTIKAMLLSTKAAGVGLTLTGADRVIVYDPSWTPAEDAQAIDRCYRIGQTKPVVVYRMIAAGTVEEKMYEKQIYKDGIRRTVFTEGTPIARYFDRHELRNLFCLGDPGVCAVMDKIQDKTFDWTDHSFLLNQSHTVGLSNHGGFYKASEDDEDDFIVSDSETIELLDSEDEVEVLSDNSFHIPRRIRDVPTETASGRSASLASPKVNGKENPFAQADALLTNGKPIRSLKLLMSTLENKSQDLSEEETHQLHKKIANQGHDLNLIAY